MKESVVAGLLNAVGEELRTIVREEVQKAAGPGVASAAPEVMTREQVAKLIQVHPNVVGRYIRERNLPAVKLGSEWRFLRAQVLEWLSRQKEHA